MAGERDITIRFRVLDDGTVAVIDKAGEKIRTLGERVDEANTASVKAATGIAGFSTQTKVLGLAVIAATIGIERLIKVSRAALSAYAEQQQATTLLNAALTATGQFTETYSRRLQDQASSLERVTSSSDETIQTIQRQLIIFGATEEQVGSLTEHVLNYSVAMGTDAHSAVMAFGRALQGNYSYFRRLGVQIDENASSTEKWTQMMTYMERFQGQARASTDTLKGSVDQLGNAWDNLKEEVGENIDRLFGVTGKIQALTSGVQTLESALNRLTAAGQSQVDINLAIEDSARRAGAAFSEMEIAAARHMAARRGMVLPGEEPDTGFVGPTDVNVETALSIRRLEERDRERIASANRARIEAQKIARQAQQDARAAAQQAARDEKQIQEAVLAAGERIVDQERGRLVLAEERARLNGEDVEAQRAVYEQKIAVLTAEQRLVELQGQGTAEMQAQIAVLREQANAVEDLAAKRAQAAATQRGESNIYQLLGLLSHGDPSIAGSAFFQRVVQEQLLPKLQGAFPAMGGAMASGYGAIVMAAIGAITESTREVNKSKWELGISKEDLIMRAQGAAVRGSLEAIGLGGIGRPLGGVFEHFNLGPSFGQQMFAASVMDMFLPLLGTLLTNSSIIQPKTTGSIIRKGVADLAGESGLPQALWLSGGGRRGLRTQFLEGVPTSWDSSQFAALGYPELGFPGGVRPYGETLGGSQPALFQQLMANAQPGVSEMRFGGALALGQLAVGAEGGLPAVLNFTNTLTNNLMALGVSADQAKLYVQGLARTMGVDFQTGLAELNRQGLQGEITAEQLATNIAGLVELFGEDLPESIDVVALATANLTKTAHGAYIETEAFTDALQRQINAYELGRQGISGISDILYTGAIGLEQQARSITLGGLSPRQQWKAYERELREGDIRYAALQASIGGGTPTLGQSAEIEAWLTRRGQIGTGIAGLSSQFSGPMAATARAYGVDIITETAGAMREFSSRLDPLILSNNNNTSATEKNTQALEALAIAMTYGQGNLDTLKITDFVKFVAQAQTNPQLRYILQQIVGQL